MRITFALPGTASTGGGLRVISQYAAHLTAQGHQVTLVVRRPDRVYGVRQKLLNMIRFRRPYPPLPAKCGYFADLGLPIVHLDENRPLQVEDLPDADVIVSTWWTTAEWANRLPATKGRHIHFIQGYEDFKRDLSHRVHAVYNQSNPKIVVAGWLQDLLRERHGQDSILVMNGVDTTKFSAPPRERMNPSCVGMLWSEHPDKNCGMAIEAIKKLRMLRPDLQGHIFGVGKPPDLPDWITYEQTPAQARIPEIYASCDLWLFSTIREGFGLPLLEAMACRTPVLATPAGAAPDLIQNGRNGVLIAADITADDMATAADTVLSRDAVTWREMSDRAWQTAQRHDLSHAAQAFEAAVLTTIRN